MPISQLLASGVGGALPMLMAKEHRRKKAEEAAAAAEAESKTTSVGNVGTVTKMKKGGMTASKRADGCAQRGKTRGKII